jgi:hypothetical protein
MFNAKFFSRDPLKFSSASADCQINEETALLLAELGVAGRTVSLKSGAAAQFHLGTIEELSDKDSYKKSLEKRVVRGRAATCGTHSKTWTEQQQVLADVEFWNRRLGKGDYYCQLESDKVSYTFFAMSEVVRFISEHARWRLLPTGRIKGDLPDPTKGNQEKMSAILTFEYRPEHQSFVIGAHGGQNGYRFTQILKKHIPFVTLKY